MLEPITITLADKSYTIKQLTIGQLRDLHIGVVLPDMKEDPQENTRRTFVRAVSVISAALSEDYPDVTQSSLWKMRFSVEERNSAVAAILKYAGLADSAEGATKGEAPAGAASTGPASSAD